MMKNTKEISISVISLIVVLVLGFVLIGGVNSFTAPIIEANAASGQNEALQALIPDAAGFALLYDAEAAEESELHDVPATVRSIYAETSGLGYVISCTTTQGYTGDPMDLTVVIDGEGKIASAQVDTYPDSRDFDQEAYPLTFVGQDSTLAEVSLVAGCTFSSSAYKNAVADAFEALIANELVGAGVKDDSQVLNELIPVVFPGMANKAAILQAEEIDVSGASYAVLGYRALNDAGCAFHMTDGKANYLAIANSTGACSIFGTDGTDCTASVDPAMVQEALALTAQSIEDYSEKSLKRLLPRVSETAEAETLVLNGVFGSVTNAFRITDGDAVYYGFAARSFGYSNEPLELYYVLDADGAISYMNCTEFILFSEYFTAYELDEDAYREGFLGLTQDSFTGAEALVSGATMTSDAVEVATADVFAAFAAVREG